MTYCIVFTRFSTARVIGNFYILVANQALNLYSGMLSSGLLCCNACSMLSYFFSLIPRLCVECWILNFFIDLSAYFAENRDMTHSVTPRVLCKVDIVHVVNRIKKGKICPVSWYEGPEGEWNYSSTLSLATMLDGGGCLIHAPAALPPWKRSGSLCIGNWVAFKAGLNS